MDKKINLNERIFVAGAHGMAGSAICKKLKEHGYGDTKNGGAILNPKRDDLNLLELDSIKKWFKQNKPSILIIAAAKVGGIYANYSQPASFLLDNLRIETNLFEAVREFKVKRLLFLGSSCIYPKLSPQPIKEEYLLSSYLESTNEWYAIAKIAGIKLCQSFRSQYGIDAISLMPTNLYGPGDNYNQESSHVMASLIRKFYEAQKFNKSEVICWGTGSPLREFLHVDDLGEAVVFALENWNPDENGPSDEYGNKLNYLNVGTGLDISIKKLAKMIASEYGYEGNISWDNSKPDGTPKKLLDISRLSKLGWESKINLVEGIKKTIKEFKSIYGTDKIKI